MLKLMLKKTLISALAASSLFIADVALAADKKIIKIKTSEKVTQREESSISSDTLSSNNNSTNQSKQSLYGVELLAALQKMQGKAKEIVYYNDSLMSELVWDIKDLNMANLGAKTKAGDFEFSGNYAFNINEGKESSRMTDRDWLGTPNGLVNGNSQPGSWSHESIHKIKVNKAYNFDIKMAYKPNPEGFSVNAGFKKMMFSFQDRGSGSYTYSSDASTVSGFRDMKGSFNERAIDYRQTFNIPYIGVAYDKSFLNNKVSVNIYGAHSNKVSAYDWDNHMMRSIVFKGTFKNGKYYNLGINSSYKVTEPFSVGFGVDYNEIREMVGNTSQYDYSSGQGSVSNMSAGISNKTYTYSMFTKYNF